jgi:tetratricopeptide (TPR) repeat protein
MLGQGDTAAELYNELLAKTSDLPALQESVHAKLANIYLRSSNKEKAAEQLKALLKSDPTNPQPYYFLGHLALDQQKTADAVDYFSKTIVLSPDFEQAYYEMANAQLVLDKPLDALNTLEKAREKFAAGFAMEFFSAIASTRLKDYDRALRHFTAAEVIANATDPKRLNHFFHFQLGIAYEQKKEHEQAAKAFEKSLELSPDFTDAMNYLGYMWADLGTNLDKAVLLLEKAVKAEPKNAAYLDSLGWACFKLNRLPEALEHVAKAVELSEEPDAVLFDHLGDILATMGRMEKAVEAWEKSLKVETKDEVKRKIEKARPNP